MLIQAARLLFGPRTKWPTRVDVRRRGRSPNLILPWNRLVIVTLLGFVLLLVWLMMNKTRLGMFVRAVTQNRPMAGCVGCPPRASTLWLSALGSGIARPGRRGLSQIANVGPDMGTGHRRFLHGGRAPAAGPAGRRGVGAPPARVVSKVPRRLGWRGDRQDPGAGLHHHLHPEASAGLFALKGRFGNWEGDMRTPATIKLVAGLGPGLAQAVAIVAAAGGLGAGARCSPDGCRAIRCTSPTYAITLHRQDHVCYALWPWRWT